MTARDELSQVKDIEDPILRAKVAWELMGDLIKCVKEARKLTGRSLNAALNANDGMSRADLARQIGMHPTTLTTVLRGVFNDEVSEYRGGHP